MFQWEPQFWPLVVLYVPEREVDPCLGHARFLGDLVLEVLLRVAGHDQQGRGPVSVHLPSRVAREHFTEDGV